MGASTAVTVSASAFFSRIPWKSDWLRVLSCPCTKIKVQVSFNPLIHVRTSPDSSRFSTNSISFRDSNAISLLKDSENPNYHLVKSSPTQHLQVHAKSRSSSDFDNDTDKDEILPSTSSRQIPLKVNPGRKNAKEKTNSTPKYSKAARRYYNEKFREPERLSKVLAAAGVSSRRGSEEIIFAGRVSVNGMTCNTPQTRVDPFKDIISVDGISLPRKLPPKLYFALNKPKGYICSNAENSSKSVISLLDSYMKVWALRNPGTPKPRLFTVGRLDVATSGLILVTNDGEFAQKVAHPSSGLTKEYIVCVKGRVSRRQLQVICNGTAVEGVHCSPASVELLEENEGKQRLRIVVCEGRNHEVRHLIENSGLKILSLKRVRIGNFMLPQNLRLGMHQVLSEAEIKKMLDCINEVQDDSYH